MVVGERIKQIRKNQNLTMEAFGQRIGVTRNSISMIESGRNNPSEQTIRSICREFNVNEDWLRTGTGDIHNQTKMFNLDEFARQRGASELELEFVKTFFEMSDNTRKEIMNNFSMLFSQQHSSTIENAQHR